MALHDSDMQALIVIVNCRTECRYSQGLWLGLGCQLMALAAICRKPHAEREYAVQSLGILTAWVAIFLNLRWRPMAMPATSILAEQSGARMLLGRQAACRWAARQAHLSSLAEDRDVRDAIRSLGTLRGQQRGNAECTALHMRICT